MLQIVAPLPGVSYAPELYALEHYLAGTSDVRMHLLPPAESLDALSEFDLLYLKMGFAPAWRSSALPEIHDYASASGGRTRWLKDAMKSQLSRRPVLRSFLSEEVRRRIPFRDDIAYIYRDMGVPESFLAAATMRSEEPDFDLLYAGSITQSRNTAELFRAVQQAGMTILAAGTPEDSIFHEFKTSSQVVFSGRIPLSEMPKISARCRLGVNYTPDRGPYNVQTSTKVLEYLALGLPVVTNDYHWIRVFEAESGADMCKLGSLEALNEQVFDYPFVVPDMKSYAWSSIFVRSGIYPALRGLVST